MTKSQSPAPAAKLPQEPQAARTGRLSRRNDDAHVAMLNRLLDDDGVSRLQVAAFNSSI